MCFLFVWRCGVLAFGCCVAYICCLLFGIVCNRRLVSRIRKGRSRCRRELSEDVNDEKVLGTGILWATFATHQVMRDYMKHGIENHPSMASEYVRFLVANSGWSKMQQIEGRLKKLEEENIQLKKDVVAADKAAKSAGNKADEAKTLAKKK